MPSTVWEILGVAATTIGAFDLAGGFLDASIADLRAQGRLGLLAQSSCTCTACSAAPNGVPTGQ
ncbi:hypothetical protein ACWDA3_21805 [Nonomuraea rubra]